MQSINSKILATTVFCPGFQKGRVPSEKGRVPSEKGRVPSEKGRVLSEKGTFSALNGPSKGHN